jgi:hypothetical protein
MSNKDSKHVLTRSEEMSITEHLLKKKIVAKLREKQAEDNVAEEQGYDLFVDEMESYR